MMRQIFLSFTFIILLGNCSFGQIPPINLLEVVKVGSKISKIQSSLNGYQFKEESLFNYGVDSESTGISILLDKQKLIFIWSKQNSDKIHEIIVLSPDVAIDGNISVGPTIEELLRFYPDSEIQLDALNQESEFAIPKDSFFYAEFNEPAKQKVAEFNEDYSIRKIRNLQAEIDRIRIFK